jgi:hypothetical protein
LPQPSRSPAVARWDSGARSGAFIAIAACLLLLRAAPTLGAEFHCSGGDVACLIASVNSANASAGPHVIHLDAGTYALSSADNDAEGPTGLPALITDITIRGHNTKDTFIQRGTAPPPPPPSDPFPLFRIAYVSASGSVTLASVTLRYGSLPSSDPTPFEGGGILNRGTLAMRDSAVTQNHGDRGVGAGINNHGTLTITDSTVSENVAELGGSGSIFSDGELSITQSSIDGSVSSGSAGGIAILGHATISDSSVDGSADSCGGGIVIGVTGAAEITNSFIRGNNYDDGGGGLCNFGSATLRNSTISGVGFGGSGGGVVNYGTMTLTNCTVVDGSAIDGGGIFNTPVGTMNLINTVVARNSLFNESFLGPDCLGSITSLGHNLIGDPSGCTITLLANDKTGDPGLGALIGGAASPIAGSVLIDSGDPTDCSSSDQLGQARTDGDGNGTVVCDIGAVEFQPVIPVGLVVDPMVAKESDGNGVLEPGETVIVRAQWRNDSKETRVLAGSASDFQGPAGSDYAIPDSTADYGTAPAQTTVDCQASGDCYSISISSSGARPATHWDATFEEALENGPARIWKVHVGESFADVLRSNLYYKPIETLLHNGVALGCTTDAFCPADPVRRDQMAIFLGRALAGGAANIPGSGLVGARTYTCALGGSSLFSDIAPDDASCRAIHYIASQNVTEGCGNGEFCVSPDVTRAAMSMFVARSMVAPRGGAAVPLTYGPDPATGRSYSCAAYSPNLHFADVSANDSFCKHVHYLWAKGVAGGCGPTTVCPSGLVTRGEMAKFLSNAFGLKLYGP